MYAKFQLHPPYGFWGEDFFEYFFRKFTLYIAMATNQIQRFGQNSYQRRGLLKKHFCKKNLNACSETAKIANFHFSHYKSMETISCHSNQSSYPIGTKNTIIRSPAPIDAICEIWKQSASRLQRRCRLKKLTDRQTTDGQRMPTYTISSPMSPGELKLTFQDPWRPM